MRKSITGLLLGGDATEMRLPPRQPPSADCVRSNAVGGNSGHSMSWTESATSPTGVARHLLLLAARNRPISCHHHLQSPIYTALVLLAVGYIRVLSRCQGFLKTRHVPTRCSGWRRPWERR